MKRVAAVSIFVLLSMACSNKTEPFNEISTLSLETTVPVTETTTTVAETKITQTLENPYQGYISGLYSDPAVWLCWPSSDDVCERDQTATAIYPDGTSEVISFEKASESAVDCFYVYPTTSGDMTPNSDLIPALTEEISTAWVQVSRYSQVCDVYAPMYRQKTKAGISGAIEVPEDDLIGGPGTTGFEIAYEDIADAFKHYIANTSQERGFILIGHSQGAAMLTQLLKREIDQNPLLRTRLVSAHLLGGAHIDQSSSEFETISGCKDANEIGCIIAYNTFRIDAPPPSNSWFGRTWHDASWKDQDISWENISWDEVVSNPSLCVNPGNFGSGKAELTPYFFPNEDMEQVFEITTTWVTYPGLLTGECINDGTFGYLSVEILADYEDPRVGEISEDFDPQSGLHVLDMNIALGNLIIAAETQSVSYLESNS